MTTTYIAAGKNIETAPIKLGEPFGPCLLLADSSDDEPKVERWYIGGWDGVVWYERETGDGIQPRQWCELPAVAPPDLTFLQRRAVIALRRVLGNDYKFDPGSLRSAWRSSFSSRDNAFSDENDAGSASRSSAPPPRR